MSWLKKAPVMRIPNGFGGDLALTEEMFYRHIGIAGGTGSGKSTLMRSILSHARALGHAAVLNDPKGEFFEEFYRPGRDWVIDIGSEDGAHFTLEREARNEAEATAWAKAFYPGGGGSQNSFFLEGTRRIFAYLIAQHNVFNDPKSPATCARVAEWVSNPEEQLVARLMGSEFMSTISKAKEQSAGFFGHLASIGASLRMMQPAGEGYREFCVREWCERRALGEDPGWIFMTGTKMTEDANMPIQTAMMQMLIVGCQTSQGAESRPVVFLLDEVATSFRRIPELVKGMATMRSARGCMVLGLHDMAQLIDLYGREGATTIMDQASTLFTFGTNDPETWNYMERRIGRREISRLTEQRPMHLIDGHNRARNWGMQIVTEPVVMGEQIENLPIYEGYFVQRGFVVPYRTVVYPRVAQNVRREREIPAHRPAAPESVETFADYGEAVPLDEEEIAVPVDDVPPPPIVLKKRSGRGKKGAVDPLALQVQMTIEGLIDRYEDFGDPVPVD